MITPRLLRRSLRRGLRWRVLLLFWASLIVPGAIAAGPAFAFLRQSLDRSPAAAGAVAWMDGATAIEVFRRLSTEGAWHPLAAGLSGAVLALLVFAPFAAGAMVASAQSGEAMGFGALMAAATGLYGRMLRTALAGLIPLGLAAAAVAGIVRLAANADERAVTETAAYRIGAAAAVAGAAVFFVCHLLLDLARAQFAADPRRRSALFALWRAARVLFAHPLRALGVGAAGAVLGFGLALCLMALRLQIDQHGAAAMAVAWLLAQGAQLAVGWGRAVRIEGLAELSRTDDADRARLEPVPAPVVHSTTLSALDPPRSGAPR